MTDDRCQPAAFTLAELLVAIAIVVVVAGVTTLAAGRVLDDARLASGTNTVTAALTDARATALAGNGAALVVFRPVTDHDGDALATTLAIWSGDTMVTTVDGARAVVDRFVPVPTASSRRMPRGILVAGPGYRSSSDTADGDGTWITPSRLSRVTAVPAEAAGGLLGVLFGPDGVTRTGHSDHDATHIWIDFDGDGGQRLDGAGDTPDPWQIDHPGDEPFVNVVPYLAVFDDEAARILVGDDDWRGPGGAATRLRELSGYITARANRIHFNAFTGVSMR